MKMKMMPSPEIHLSDKNYLMQRDPGVISYEAEIDGFVRRWDEYVPQNYDPSKKWPLMISVHGGGGNNLCRKFAWHLLAERDGMIVCYPESISNTVMWNVFGDKTREEGYPDEMVFFDKLYDIMLEKYNIDKERVYIHGQSFGDQMISVYLRTRAHKFAAACPSSGTIFASKFYNDDGTEIVPHECALPVCRMHGMDDDNGAMGIRPELRDELMKNGEWRRMKMEVVVQPNLYYWRSVNQCRELPHFTIRDEFNIVRYPSEIDCDTCFFALEGGEHNQRPEYVDNLWSYFLSAYRRVDGKIVKGEPIRKFEEDKNTAIFTDGSPYAYVDNNLYKMSAIARRMNGARISKYSMYIPADFVGVALDCESSISEDGLTAEYSKNGVTVQIAAGTRGCIVNETIKYIPLVEHINGVLYVPVAAVGKYLNGMRAIEGYDVTYLTYGDGEMTYDMAMMIKQVLRAEAELPPQCFVANERRYFAGAGVMGER